LETNPLYAREWWAYGFAFSEMLMVWDFGLPELPHIFAISILLLMASSKIYKVQKDSISYDRRKEDEKNLSRFRKVLHLFFPSKK